MKKAEIYFNKALKYIDDVQTGKRIAGKLEKKAVERHINDLENAPEKGLIFSKKVAQKALAFFTLLKHFEGEWAGQEFVPEGWQCFIIISIFGWLRADGRRRFKESYIEVARKNGKTTFAAGIALYCMVLDGEQGAQIYSAAVDREQAKVCWKAAKNMVEASPALRKYLETSQQAIFMASTLSTFKPFSKDTKNKDGFNPHCAICDELHAWPTDEIYNLIISGMGARRQPLVFSITTAGFNKDLPCYEMRTLYIDVLMGLKVQEDTFILIFSPDKDDDWKDPKTWEKANPNYGVSVYPEYMEDELDKALNRKSREVNFKTKNLNMWVDAPDVWISDEIVAANDYGTNPEDLLGKTCYGGLDLASHVDIVALALMFPEEPHCPVLFYFWIPEGKVKEKEDRVDYRAWKEMGVIRITNGDVIDIDEHVQDIDTILKMYDVKNVSFDPAKAYHGTIQGLQKNGWDDVLDEYAQNMAHMSEPTKKLEAMITGKEMDLMGNPCIRWMFRNVVVYRDANDNIKLDKKRSIEKIDGVVATVNAIGGWISLGAKAKPDAYRDHDLRVIYM